MLRRTFLGSAAAAAFAQQGPRREAIHAGAIHAYIDANLEGHVAKLQEYVRQPSISAEKVGIAECAQLTRKYLEAAGCRETALIPTPGHPGVWGYLDAGAPKTYAVYWMYDVQPVNPSEWKTPPFEARVVADESFGPKGRILRGRGATNQKGPERAFLNAIEAIHAVAGKMPVNLMFLCEGEEELGSPHMPEMVAKYKDRLKRAEGVVFPMNGQGKDGSVSATLGNKGICYLHLECLGGAWGGPKAAEVHSSLKATIDSPVWRLVQALASMTDASGNEIRIEGLKAGIRQPSGREKDIFETFLRQYDDASVKAGLSVDRWIGGADKREHLRKLWFDTTLNIDGVWGGYSGPGTKTILPHKANAKIDFRLVPDQKAADVPVLLRKHLDKHGFTDVTITSWDGYDASQTDPDHPLVKAALDVYAAWGTPARVTLRNAGSAPMYVFTRDLGIPVMHFGLNHGAGSHSLDEYIVIEGSGPVKGLAAMEKAYVDLLYRIA